MKTWEMLKMLEENSGLVFQGESGDWLKLGNDGKVLMDYNNGWEEYCYLDIDDKWEIIPQGVSINEALHLLKNGGKVKFEVDDDGYVLFSTIQYNTNYRYIEFLDGNIEKFSVNEKYMLFTEALISGTWYKAD